MQINNVNPCDKFTVNTHSVIQTFISTYSICEKDEFSVMAKRQNTYGSDVNFSAPLKWYMPLKMLRLITIIEIPYKQKSLYGIVLLHSASNTAFKLVGNWI